MQTLGEGEPMEHADTILRKSAVVERTGASASTIDRMERRGEFPRRIPVTENRVGWSLKEVADWIEQRKAAR